MIGSFVFFEKCNILKIEQCPLIRKLCLACLLNFAEQSSWAELVCQGGLSDKRIMRGTFRIIEKLSYLESSVKIWDVVGICRCDALDVTLFQLKILMYLLLITNTKMKLSRWTYPFHLNTMDSSTIKLPFLLWATSLSSKIRMTLR